MDEKLKEIVGMVVFFGGIAILVSFGLYALFSMPRVYEYDVCVVFEEKNCTIYDYDKWACWQCPDDYKAQLREHNYTIEYQDVCVRSNMKCLQTISTDCLNQSVCKGLRSSLSTDSPIYEEDD